MEDVHPDGGLLLVNHVRGFILVFPVPTVGAASDADRQADLYARLPAPVGVFDNLMALALGAPGQNRADKLARQAVVNVLANTDDLSPGAFDLLKDHGRVHEVAREAAQVEDDNHVSQAVADELPGKGQFLAQAIVNIPAFRLLVVQAFAVNLLLVGADAAVDDCPLAPRGRLRGYGGIHISLLPG